MESLFNIFNVQISPIDKSTLLNLIMDFFVALKKGGGTKYFDPFTKKHMRKILDNPGKDYYALMTENDKIIGIGMLRGWDDGWKDPMLSIAIDPAYHGKGLGRKMMQHLHKTAASFGSTKICLSVYDGNEIAINLYKSMGYKLTLQPGWLFGVFELNKAES